MNKATTAELAWLFSVFQQAERIADKYDPKRKHESSFANALDGICQATKAAYAYGSGGLSIYAHVCGNTTTCRKAEEEK